VRREYRKLILFLVLSLMAYEKFSFSLCGCVRLKEGMVITIEPGTLNPTCLRSRGR